MIGKCIITYTNKNVMHSAICVQRVKPLGKTRNVTVDPPDGLKSDMENGASAFQ